MVQARGKPYPKTSLVVVTNSAVNGGIGLKTLAKEIAPIWTQAIHRPLATY
jgi:hypothetical protein